LSSFLGVTLAFLSCRIENAAVHFLCIVKVLLEFGSQLWCAKLQRKLVYGWLFICIVLSYPYPAFVTASIWSQVTIWSHINNVVVCYNLLRLLLPEQKTHSTCRLVLQELRLTQASLLPFSITVSVQFGPLRIQLVFVAFANIYVILDLQCH
jgi:hypothetical protein